RAGEWLAFRCGGRLLSPRTFAASRSSTILQDARIRLHRQPGPDLGVPGTLDEARPGYRHRPRTDVYRRLRERPILRPGRPDEGGEPEAAGAEIRTAGASALRGGEANRLHELQLPSRSFRRRLGHSGRGRRAGPYRLRGLWNGSISRRHVPDPRQERGPMAHRGARSARTPARRPLDVVGFGKELAVAGKSRGVSGQERG